MTLAKNIYDMKIYIYIHTQNLYRIDIVFTILLNVGKLLDL